MANVFSVELPDLRALQKDIERVGETAMPRLKFGLEQFLSFVADKARLKCPVKTGHLQSSITHQISKSTDRAIEGRVGSNVDYAPYVELGTGIYGPRKTPIRPKNKKVLAWVVRGPRPTTPEGWRQACREGRAVLVKEVQGMKPRPYLLPALTENIERLVEFLKKALK